MCRKCTAKIYDLFEMQYNYGNNYKKSGILNLHLILHPSLPDKVAFRT